MTPIPIVGQFDRSSSLYPGGAVYRYEVGEVEWTGGEIMRLLQLKAARERYYAIELSYVVKLVAGIRRVCRCCGQAKPLAEYYRARGAFRIVCKDCMRAKRKAHYWRTKVAQG